MIYDRKTVLSLKIRGQLLKKLTRAELFSRMQLIRTIEPITAEAYKQVEQDIWENQLDNSPHGSPWHVSFHASQFPGDDPMACPRAALYQMMDFSSQGPFSRRSRVVMDAGKAIEVNLVKTWEKAGILLSASPDEEHQTGFEYPDAWLTASVDSVLLPPRWNKPLVVEVKTKYKQDIEAMQIGTKGPDTGHIFQIKVQMALVRAFQDKLWPGLDPLTHGVLYYLSRDKPDETAEFRVDYDQKFFDVGVERLKQWRGWFEEGVLPSINPSKRHPMGWRWSYQPCSWCDFKKTCQLDHQEGVSDLMESIGIDRTQAVRPNYDPEGARLRVRARWQHELRTSDKITASGPDGHTEEISRENSD